MEQERLEGEYHRVRKDKQPLWVRSSFRVIHDIDHGHARVIELATDLTERRDMEIRLRQAKEKAEFAAQVKTNFLANMSHEIRTPMNAIIGFTDLMLDTPLQPTQQRHLTTIRKSAQSLLSLLNDILDTAKLEQGAVILESIDFSLRDVCDQVLATLGLSAYKKDLELICDYPEEQPTWFKGDPLRIQQVLINLVGNAIKFTHHGRVVVSVKYENDLLLIKVLDTGVGIAADRLEAIFDPFSQEDASTTRKYGGTGLGTSISKQLVEAMKGDIRVTSELGKGSCFSIELPLPVGKEVITPRRRAIQAQLPPLRILIADDVPQNLELLALNFEKESHQLQLVTNGYEAVSAFKEHPFDLVLMDVQMPEMDGYDATLNIREWERMQQQSPTPIIALTANVLEQDRLNAERAGMSGFAIKPLNMQALREEIVRVLQLKLSEDEPSSDRHFPLEGDEIKGVDVIDYAQGVALWGSKQALHNVIKRFLAQNKETVDALVSLNASQLLEQAHRLKGAAGNLALKSLAHALDALEKALKDKGPSHHYDEEIRALTLAFQEVYALFDTLPNEIVFESQIQLNIDSVEKAKALINQMLARLDKGELPDDCLDALAECIGSHALVTLTDCLEDFDFDCAHSALLTLQESLNSNQEGDKLHESYRCSP
ncbi:ATP-binding protein [Nitrincola nitratireducens]|uniref:histidine kinase n=1 Tax=Nitrincola nitratireducens TaxID=1229521 RepID=W9VKB8_9GAMM|nr:ATP-binding protein [Nitrincola nitratireducens]EXJ10990.1 Autoinducer 2 sensor kinase/phosphatase luxQ [Nitrincola nitratireducens]